MNIVSLESQVSSEADLDVWIALGVDGVDEPDLMWHGRHDQSVRPSAVSEEADAAEQRAVRDSRRREDDALAGGEVFGAIDALDVRNPHALEPLAVRFLGEDELGLDLAVETPHCGRGEHA